MSVKQDLKDFYNTSAKKYYETRKKIRYDGKRILEELKKYKPERDDVSKKIKILELGCGWGRFCDYLRDNFNKNVEYTGVDLSQNLLDLAQKDHPKKKFICDDMVNFVRNEEQEKYDFIVITAAFQHIPSYKERILLMKYFYSILKYEGKLIMLNWVMSDWFKNKYAVEIRKTFWKYVLSLGKSKLNDVLVPWKNQDKTFYRYYHLFTVKELTQITKIWGFVVEKSEYLDKKWQIVDSRNIANNSLIIAIKKVFL